MQSDPQTAPTSKGLTWTGRVLSGLVVLFMAFDGGSKIAQVPAVVEKSGELGFSASTVLGLGIVLAVSTLLYAVPATSILGAILLTGYLGGAIATHVRMGGPAFPIVFASLFGVLTWLGLFLREPRLRRLLPLRR